MKNLHPEFVKLDDHFIRTYPLDSLYQTPGQADLENCRFFLYVGVYCSIKNNGSRLIQYKSVLSQVPGLRSKMLYKSLYRNK